MMPVLVNLIGVLLIIFIIIWFWLVKPKTKIITNGKNIIDIVVADGVYKPTLITAKAGQKLTLRFIREDASPCAEVVVFPKLDINAELPLHHPYLLHLQIDQAGEYEFTCQMGMYRGKLIVLSRDG